MIKIHMIFLLLLIAVFIGAATAAAHNVRCQMGHQAQRETDELKAACQDLIQGKERVLLSKKLLSKQAEKIFLLYEMTKEITKKLSQEEAFQVFQDKLKQSVSIEECRLLDATAGEGESGREPKDYFFFPLESERKVIGYLALKGVAPHNEDKVIILSHQFALALRQVQLYHEIEQLAILDGLTGVYTRRYLWDRFGEELERSKLRGLKFSFLLIDVDHFKTLNDRYGHLTGDQVLKRAGAILREHVREIDIIGRLGGEEFGVLLPDTPLEGALFVAERIRSAIEEHSIKAYDTLLRITISVGISSFPKDGETINELMDKADWALYRAKKTGRNRICAFGVYNERGHLD
jgi:diguanylate cyclase (GGDEF)-like protein